MVPSNGWTLLLFLLLVCPGLRYELLAQRRFARPDESVFLEISRVLLASVCFAAVASGVVAVADAIFLNVSLAHVVQPNAFIQSHPADALSVIGVQLAASLVAVQVWDQLVVRYSLYGRRMRAGEGATAGSVRVISPVHAWTSAFREQLPVVDGVDVLPYVRVRMVDGRAYLGVVESFTAGPSDPRRELVLVPPLHSSKPGRTPTAIDASFARLVLSDQHIDSIAVAYYDRDDLLGHRRT